MIISNIINFIKLFVLLITVAKIVKIDNSSVVYYCSIWLGLGVACLNFFYVTVVELRRALLELRLVLSTRVTKAWSETRIVHDPNVL